MSTPGAISEPGTLKVYDVVESTNDLVMTAAQEGAPSGYAVVADAQTGGRGRRNTDGTRRSWHSPKGKNLYLSLLLRPDLRPEQFSALTLAAGVALLETLEAYCGLQPWLKWPNDLYVKERKIAGILTEAVTGASGIEGVVIGVGLNVNLRGQDFPLELSEMATSVLEETGQTTDRLGLALEVSAALRAASQEYEAQGLSAFEERLRHYDGLVGRALEVRENGQLRRGAACGIGPRGGLMVQWEQGSRSELISGEVQVLGLSKETSSRP